MTWSIAPTLDINKFSNISCLLIGAGTLGCNVARGLVMWGVKNITFIDHGSINYSNPIRQNLYLYNDCLTLNNKKAFVAAKNLLNVSPFLNVKGIDFSIPIPGQILIDKLKFKNDIYKLESLIQSHDVIFLLTDSRESRWLPTLLSFAFEKPVINAAIGFDSFLVIRYSGNCNSNIKNLYSNIENLNSNELCCYFCSDSVIPQNTLNNRTLDQQCTVTRPGISLLASSFTIELFASLVQHPLSFSAPININEQNHSNQLFNKHIPHIIRFFLSSCEILPIFGKRYQHCVACSQHVLTQYKLYGSDYILSVICNPNLLKQSNDLSIDNFNHNQNNTTTKNDKNWTLL